MLKLLSRLFTKVPEKFATLHFPETSTPFREFRIIGEDSTTLLLRGPIEVSGITFPDMEKRVLKKSRRIKRVFERRV